MSQGDQNSKFFHKVAKNYNKNTVPYLIDDQGSLFQSPEGTITQAVYSISNGEADNDMLPALPYEEEFREATFSIGRDKATSPDGY